MMYKQKYLKYKSKYLGLKMNQAGGKIKVINVEPKYKMIRYEKRKIYASNNMDADKLDELSEFLLASCTKLFTLTMVLILHKNNLLNINDTCDKYLPVSKNNDFSKITIWQLLNHKSGAKRMPDKIIHKRYITATEVCESFINEKIFTLNKGDFNYSNLGYILLGAIIELVTKMIYIDAYKYYIFDELKLNHTGIGETNIVLYNRNKRKLTPKQYNERYLASTGGALYSCVHDLIIFAKNIKKLLNSDTLDILKDTYMASTHDDKIYLNHSGSIYGGKSMISYKFTTNFDYVDALIFLETIENQ